MKLTGNIFLLLIFCFAVSCGHSTVKNTPPLNHDSLPPKADSISVQHTILPPDSIIDYIPITRNIKMKEYFPFIDKLIKQCDTMYSWKLTEHILVNANPFIIDTLMSWDYYKLMEKGHFVYDQTELIILRAGDSLAVPDSNYARKIQARLSTTTIDVNIPEFKLRLIQENDTILVADVRVGRDAEKFLYVVGRVVNLRTPIGIGEIVSIDRAHKVINLDTGKEYPGTNRDDGKFTKMPIIPWMEPSINGIRYGAMIHPTTNPSTLGRAYSHGCVGTSEANAWKIYYQSPKGTRVIFRYDLQVINEQGDTVYLKDIYHLLD